MTTEENNQLIAEFMGVKPNKDGEYEMYQALDFIEDGEDEKHSYSGKEMEFKASWNWIMPVVEKVDQIGASVIIGRMFCEIKYIDPLNQSKHFEVRIASGVKINAINGAIVDFIQWYNENKS